MTLRIPLRRELSIGVGIITVFIGTVMLLVLPGQFNQLGRDAMEQEALALATVMAQASGASVITAQALDDPALAAGIGRIERAVQDDVGDGVEGPGAEVLTDS